MATKLTGFTKTMDDKFKPHPVLKDFVQVNILGKNFDAWAKLAEYGVDGLVEDFQIDEKFAKAIIRVAGSEAKAEATSVTEASSAESQTAAALMEVIKKMGENDQATGAGLLALAAAQTASDSHVCGSCGQNVPKEYNGEYCPFCGGPLSTTVSECPICMTAVPSIIKGAQVCVNGECGAPLWEGDNANALRYLVNTGDSVRLAKLAVENADTESGEFKKWVREGKKLSGPVLKTSNDAQEAVRAINSPDDFRRGVNLSARW